MIGVVCELQWENNCMHITCAHTVLSPVFDEPVFLSAFGAVAHHQHTVVQLALRAEKGVVHSAMVHLHGGS